MSQATDTFASMMGLPSEEVRMPSGYRLEGAPGRWKHAPGTWRAQTFTTPQEASEAAWEHRRRSMEREMHR